VADQRGSIAVPSSSFIEHVEPGHNSFLKISQMGKSGREKFLIVWNDSK